MNETNQDHHLHLIRVTELIQLTNLGVSVTDISWAKVKVTADHWICVRQTFAINGHPSNGIKYKNGQFVRILLCNGALSEARHFETSNLVNCAQVNHIKSTIALSTEDDRIYLINLSTYKCIKYIRLHYKVIHWSWLTDSVIGLVSVYSVYHWDILSDSLPRLIFNRHLRLNECQLTSYAADPYFSWFALSGLCVDSEKNDVVNGITQVYSTHYNLSQCIEAHAVQFTSFKFPGNIFPSNMLVAVKKVSSKSGKLFLIELGPINHNNSALISRTEFFPWSDPLETKYDFPVSVVTSSQLGIIYILSKYGSLYVCDMECGSLIINRIPICVDIIFAAVVDESTQGVLVLSRNGQILLIELKLDELISYISKETSKKYLAQRLKDVVSSNLFTEEVTKL